eukprot:2174288-Amphidinium_carterae.1
MRVHKSPHPCDHCPNQTTKVTKLCGDSGEVAVKSVAAALPIPAKQVGDKLDVLHRLESEKSSHEESWEVGVNTMTNSTIIAMLHPWLSSCEQ